MPDAARVRVQSAIRVSSLRSNAAIHHSLLPKSDTDLLNFPSAERRYVQKSPLQAKQISFVFIYLFNETLERSRRGIFFYPPWGSTCGTQNGRYSTWMCVNILCKKRCCALYYLAFLRNCGAVQGNLWNGAADNNEQQRDVEYGTKSGVENPLIQIRSV